MRPRFPVPIVFSLLVLTCVRANAAPAVGSVFYILLENRNFTAGGDLSGGAPLLGNPAAPFFNRTLLNPTTAIGAQVSYAAAYHNVGATPGGASAGLHPSEPNYLWFESGSNFGVTNDNDPFGAAPQVTTIATFGAPPSGVHEHLTGLLQAAGISWRYYLEDIDQKSVSESNANLGGALTSTLAARRLWTVPLDSFSGSGPRYVNPYNGSDQWAFAAKHAPALFFPDTNGSSTVAANRKHTNRAVAHYAPLAQLAADLTGAATARFNVITPDLYNDMHTPLAGGFTYRGVHYTGDAAQVAQGDNFLSVLIPQIMASEAYRDNGVIVIWTDETEGARPDDFSHTLPLVVISSLAKGAGYASTVNFTHSSDLATLQKIFQVPASTPTGFLGEAATAEDLSDLFQSGVIPAALAVSNAEAGGEIAEAVAATVIAAGSEAAGLPGALALPVFGPASRMFEQQ